MTDERTGPVRDMVVVGASLAGLRAVEAARRAGFDGRLTLVGAEEHLPYDRPPLSKACLDAADAPSVTYREQESLAELEVELLLGEPATALDADRGALAVGDREVPFDAAVLCTGARARTLPGADHLAGVHTLRTLDDALAVRAALDGGARTVVIGAGFIGSEVASAARKRGLSATVVEAMPTPLVRAIGTAMGEALTDLHRAHGTEVRCGVAVDGLEEADGRVRGVRLADGTVLLADLVVVGIGAFPETDWLASAGLPLDNGIVCDETLWTGVGRVYAAGDVARWHNPLFDAAMRIEHWTSAAEQGASAARNALDPTAAKPYQTVPYFWSDWYDSRIQFVGIPGSDEVEVVSGGPEEGSFVALYRTGDRLTGALTLNRQAEIMKYRKQIAKRATWTEALEFARARAAR
ncbi:FAD-dependent oxidoreductase [Pseudonocardia sp. NPDC049154]|uniref:NAD(P)/FAD-dependent oxidoreductase n=1 Tax=Pseudonocardia sp. NPDC049154 TaxID=3155501 RepID=UPI0033FE6368